MSGSPPTEQDAAPAAAQARRPVLVVAGDAQKGGAPPPERLLAIEGSLEIGRHGSPGAPSGAWRLDDPLASSRHARIAVVAGRTLLTDLGSTNGTWVDGRRLCGDSAELREGAVVVVGRQAAVFRAISEEEVAALAEETARPLGPVATSSPALALICRRLRLLAPSAAEILLVGATGVGKEVYARGVHALSNRPGRFVAINCAALPRDLMESELFGYARGAHSTAREDKPGLVEDADRGTLFLDELAEMPPDLQAKLLRFLEDREVRRLGATRGRTVDVRVLAATGRPDDDRLRSDLLGRIGAVPLRLPPLRDRIEDLGALMAHFCAGKTPVFSTQAWTALFSYAWPRNVRELKKVIETAVVLSAEAGRVEVAHLPAVFAHEAGPPVSGGPAALAPRGRRTRRPAPSKEELEDLLRRHEGQVAEVARALDRKWQVVWRWMRAYGIRAASYREQK